MPMNVPEEIETTMPMKDSTSPDDARYAIPEGAHYAYGTSGFRMDASLMLPIAWRCGALAALLSASQTYGKGRFVGVALTASHNPAADNGIKFVAPEGGLFAPSLETLAEEVANTRDLAGIRALVARWEQHEQSQSEGAEPEAKVPRNVCDSTARVVVARDTRPSGPALEDALLEGAKAAVPSVVLVRYGVATTPEAHVAVRELNARGADTYDLSPAVLERRYLAALADAYVRALGGRAGVDSPVTLVVDAANGVGADKTKRLAELLKPAGLNVRVINDAPEDDVHVLNHECGADWVKTRSAPPLNLDAEEQRLDIRSGPDATVHYAALDGDADRVVFFVPRVEPFVLLDGDRIAALAGRTVRRLLIVSGTTLRLAVVQTAYANGASSDYLAGPEVQAPPVFTSTGVKHLHAAAEHEDVAVYFEANGHGTLLLHKRARATLQSVANDGNSAQRDAAAQIIALADLANPLVGDALADFLLVEAMLRIEDMSIADWIALYAERPSCLLKVAVPDRTAYRTTDADRRVVDPADVQPAVDALVASIPGSRAFVRPSGTEDYLRVFAEAPAQHDADRLAMAVVDYVKSRSQ